MKPKRASLGKTTRPSLASIVPRKRLFALLEAEDGSPVVWVSGPPGSGKTTLAASWLDRAALPYLWYQIDDGDADVATFFYYLSLAAGDLGEGEPLPLLTPENQPGLAVFTRRYFQILFSRLKAPFAVVFDGYQEVPASSQLHEVMRIALQEVPQGGRILLVSRGDPPASLARLRANRALALIGWEELRLTREETDSIAARRRPGIAPQALDALYARTEGWAAGVVLVLEQAKVGASIAEPRELSRKLVFDYLAGEIFQKSDERTQRFLLHTAFLPQMTAAAARELTGDPGAGELLAELHRNNYFVALRETPLASVYQYHPMLRDFLRARAEDSLAKEQRRSLQRASARLMEQLGWIEDAVALYRESHEWDEMARVIEMHAAALLDQGRGETLGRWVEELPPEVRQRHPWTIYWAATSQAQIAPREARIRFEKAFEVFRAASDNKGMALACSGAMDAILYELDDCSLLDRWIEVLDGVAQDAVLLISPELEARVARSMLISLTLRQPQRRDLGAWIERALSASARVQDVNLKIFVGLLSALTLMWTGLFSRGAELIADMRRLAGSAPGVTTFSLITLKNLEAMHASLTADSAACLKAMREGLELSSATGVHTWTFQLLLYGYGGALGSHKLDEAAVLAKQLEANRAGAGRFNLCLYYHFQGWEAMLRKDLMGALQHEKLALRMAIEVGCPYFEVLCRLALAEILAACGDERKCIAHLQTLRDIARGIDNRFLEFVCLIGFAQLAIDHGRQRPGLNALRRGLELGRQYNYGHFLWWRPGAVARVLAHALEAGIETEYARSLIKRRGLVPEQPPLTVAGWPWAFRVETFGGFRLLRHAEPLATSGKAQRRPLDLLKVVIAYGGEQVSEARITDALWPRIDGDSAHRSFTSALHRLRKLLGEDRAVVLHEGRVSLDRRYFWIDAWAFEELGTEIENAAEPAVVEKLAERMLGLYRGPFMADDVDAAWYLQPRDRMRSRLARAMGRVLRYWQDNGHGQRARDCLDKCAEIDAAATQQPGFKQLVSDR